MDSGDLADGFGRAGFHEPWAPDLAKRLLAGSLQLVERPSPPDPGEGRFPFYLAAEAVCMLGPDLPRLLRSGQVQVRGATRAGAPHAPLPHMFVGFSDAGDLRVSAQRDPHRLSLTIAHAAIPQTILDRLSIHRSAVARAKTLAKESEPKPTVGSGQ